MQLRIGYHTRNVHKPSYLWDITSYHSLFMFLVRTSEAGSVHRSWCQILHRSQYEWKIPRNCCRVFPSETSHRQPSHTIPSHYFVHNYQETKNWNIFDLFSLLVTNYSQVVLKLSNKYIDMVIEVNLTILLVLTTL